MITITIHTTFSLAQIQRADRARTYAPTASSLNRLTRLIACYHSWLFLPVPVPHVFQWARVQL